MTDYPKVPRHCLLPVLPYAGTYKQHFGAEGSPEFESQLRWLSEYSDKLSDYVVVTPQSPALVERVESVTGKRVIPTFCTVPNIAPDSCSLTIPPSEFKPSPQQIEWLSYLRSRLDHWPWIMAANSENGMDCNQGSWPLMKHLNEFVACFPDLADKFSYAPWDLALAGEAGGFAHRLDKCAVLNHFLAHKSLICVYMGYQVLYHGLAEYTGDGYNLDGTVWLHAIERKDKNWIPDDPYFQFPYRQIGDFYKHLGASWKNLYGGVQQPREQMGYYSQPRQEACAFSGIGFYTGAGRHNLSRMVEFGFTGCCFFPPAVDGDEGKRQMDLYTTDVA